MRPWVAVPLARRSFFTLVDEADLSLVEGFRWYDACYVRAGAIIHGRATTIAMHRLILGAKPGQFVDHINGDKFDNRRENLRFATRSQNAANQQRGVYVPRTGYRGISKVGARWRASCTHGKDKRFGYASTEVAAALLYDDFARALYGEFARLNFPKEGERATNTGAHYEAPPTHVGAL